MPEECDDGNTNNADSCLNNCTVRLGHACLLPGGTHDGDPVVAACPIGASCCYANAQAVVSSVRVVGGELEWTTAGEAGTLGFYVSVQDGEEWLSLHEGILPALPDAAQGAVYRLRAGSLRGRTVRIVEHELEGRSLTVFEGRPAYAGGASMLTDTNYSVTARPLTGAPDMSPDAAPSPGARRKAAGDTPTGVFALAASEGLTRVTFAEIAAELRVPVSVVQSSVGSGALSISDHGTPVAWVGTADAIVFNARRRTSVYGGTRPYELRLSAGVELVEVDRSMPDVATGVGQQRAFREVDTFPALAVSPDPTQEFWFEAALGNHNSFRDYNASIVLSNVDGGPATFDLGVYGAPGLSTEAPLTLTLTLNGQVIEAHDVTTTGLSVVSFAIPASALLPGPNTVRVRATSSAPAGTALVYVDRYTLTYGAPLEFVDAGRFVAGANGALAFELDAASGSDVYLLDATLDRVVRATRTDVDATRARFTFDAQAGHEYFVATEAGLHAPAGLRARSEQNFADAGRNAEYVVIAPAALYDAATALATRRQTQGLTTTVVDIQDIYDAFGGGDMDPYAIREFLRVAKENWQGAPRYVLLLGDGNADYRSATTYGSGTIPPMLVRTDRGVYASDMLLGDTDGDGRAEIAIGRVPAHTVEEANAFVQRVVAYESGGLDAFARHALMVSGINREIDFTQLVDSLVGQLDQRVTTERVNRAALSLTEARTQLIDAINDGSFWFHYQGHGASNQLDDDGLLTLADARALTNTDALTIFTGMSCSTARFEVPGLDSISELLLNGSPGGAIALYGPSGAGRTFESGNMAEAFHRGLLTGDNLEQGRIGDVVVGLWDEANGANATTVQLAVYLLLGDPATVLPNRSALVTPPDIIDPPEEDAGVPMTPIDGGRGMDAGSRSDAGRADAGRDNPPVDPPPGGMGGGACSAGADTNGLAGIVLLLVGLTWAGRRSRRRRS